MTPNSGLDYDNGSIPRDARGSQSCDKSSIILPVEAAQRLRWYDRADLKLLVHIHVKEKAELYDYIKTLRSLKSEEYEDEVCPSDEGKLWKSLEAMQKSDEAVASVLALAASAEADRLKLLLSQAENKLAKYNDLSNLSENVQSNDENQDDNHAPESDIIREVGEHGDVMSAVRAAQDSCLEAWKLNKTLREELDRKSHELNNLEKEVKIFRETSSLANKTHYGVSDEAVEFLENRVIELEVQASVDRESINTLETELTNLQSEIAEKNTTLLQLKSAVLERDRLAVRISMLDARSVDIDSVTTSVGLMEELLREANMRYAIAEKELVNAAKRITSLEKKIEEMELEKREAFINAEKSRNRALNAERRVLDEVVKRWKQMAFDRAQWPDNVVAELENTEGRLESLKKSYESLKVSFEEAKRNEQDILERMKNAECRAESAENSLALSKKAADDNRNQLEATVLAMNQQSKLQQDNFISLRSDLGAAMQTILEQKNRIRSLEKLVRASKILSPSDKVELSASSSESRTDVSLEQCEVDCIYTKNVVLKFLNTVICKQPEESMLLLPAIATVLGLTSSEYKELQESLLEPKSTKGLWFASFQ